MDLCDLNNSGNTVRHVGTFLNNNNNNNKQKV